MRKIFFTLFLCFSLAACSDDRFPVFVPSEDNGGDNGNVQVDPETPTDPGIPTLTTPDYSSLTAANHPRVIFTQSDFDAIASGSISGTVFQTIHNQIISGANSSVGASTLERVLTGKRLLSVSREALERLTFCAYAYKTTGEQRYLTQAETDLNSVCSFTDWNAKQHFLDVGEMAAGVALAYDWLYNELSASTKTLVRTALEDFAFTPANNKVWNLNFYEAENNWNQVCNGGLICAALAIYEDSSNAKGIIEAGIESNLNAMVAMYSPDGNYPEGYSYWCYGTMFQTLLLTALETATGSDTGLSTVSGFSDTGNFMLFMEGYLNYNFNYSDSTLSTVPALGLWYFAYKFNNTSVLFHEKKKLDSYGNSDEARLLPLVAYFASKMNLSSLDAITAPSSYIYKGEGTTPVVLVHDNWAMDSTDKFLGIKAGKANTSHGHMDAGSFVYEAYGERWASDMVRPSYNTIESAGYDLWNMNDGSDRWTLTQYNNMNHNTLTVNGAYHKVSGAATITGTVNANGRKGGVVDITAPLGNVESAVRTIYIEGDDLIITDDITAASDTDAEITWTLVTKATPSKYGNKLELKGTKGGYMYLKKSSTTGHNPSWWFTDAIVEDSCYECGYTITLKAGTKASITITLSPNE